MRLTGGEPLVRKDFPALVAMLSGLPGVRDLAVTTNGFLLERDAEALVAAGVTRFNVSIDSLQRHRFHELTRRDSLDEVLSGLKTLAALPGVGPIKVNAVALRGFTEGEVPAFVEMARNSSYQVRFIEFMPLDADHAWTQEQVLSGAELHAMIDALHPLEPLKREPSATARVYRFADGPRSDWLHQRCVRTRRFAGTATASASPPTAACAPATSSHCMRPTFVNRCELAPMMISSSRSSATPSGARSSSTTSARPASSSRPARCRQ